MNSMLLYKAWLETRARFLISFGGSVLLFSYLVYHAEKDAAPWAGMTYYNYVLNENQSVFALLWVLLVALLMVGGLLREHAAGSLYFTLALPVSRRRLMVARIAMGSTQALLLAVVPSCAMYLIASIVGKAYSPGQLAFNLVMLLAGGSVFLAITVLVSSVIEGEYTAPAVSLGLALGIALGLGSPKLRPFNPMRFMMGMEYRDIHTELLVGPIPWANAAIWVSVAGVLLLLAIGVIRRREF